VQLLNKCCNFLFLTTSEDNSFTWLELQQKMKTKSRTYSRVREGIFSLSRLDFILAEHQAGTSFTTAQRRTISQPTSILSSLLWATKNITGYRLPAASADSDWVFRGEIYNKTQ